MNSIQYEEFPFEVKESVPLITNEILLYAFFSSFLYFYFSGKNDISQCLFIKKVVRTLTVLSSIFFSFFSLFRESDEEHEIISFFSIIPISLAIYSFLQTDPEQIDRVATLPMLIPNQELIKKLKHERRRKLLDAGEPLLKILSEEHPEDFILQDYSTESLPATRSVASAQYFSLDHAQFFGTFLFFFEILLFFPDATLFVTLFFPSCALNKSRKSSENYLPTLSFMNNGTIKKPTMFLSASQGEKLSSQNNVQDALPEYRANKLKEVNGKSHISTGPEAGEASTRNGNMESDLEKDKPTTTEKDADLVKKKSEHDGDIEKAMFKFHQYEPHFKALCDYFSVHRQLTDEQIKDFVSLAIFIGDPNQQGGLKFNNFSINTGKDISTTNRKLRTLANEQINNTSSSVETNFTLKNNTGELPQNFTTEGENNSTIEENGDSVSTSNEGNEPKFESNSTRPIMDDLESTSSIHPLKHRKKRHFDTLSKVSRMNPILDPVVDNSKKHKRRHLAESLPTEKL